ncbi:MAG TPA: tripartite tricarboxylate transporter substrate-binding protein [Ramlibacter sp.]|nr:tripartite tricarboxylate transporter substrate-binding protein [Ramlibacter sp.]
MTQSFPLRRRAAVVALLALGATAAAPALATDPFPSRPITLVLPFPAGGSFDPIFRTLAEAAAKDLGQPVTYLIGLAGLTTGIVVAADAPWKSLPELLADAKKRPGTISWGNVGAISINRIYGERLARMNGMDPMIAARLAAAFRKAAADPAYLNQLEQYDMQPNVIGGEAYAAYAKLQFERDAKMLADIGFKPE